MSPYSLISFCLFTLKLWDMDELLQGSGTVTKNDTAASDSDSDDDGMDVDPDLPNTSRGMCY